MELLVVFLIIFVIYGAGWLWEALSGLLRPPPLGVVSDPPLHVAGPNNVRLNVDESFRIFAEGRGGSVRRGARGDGPRASFVHNGARAELSTPALRGGLRGFHTLLSIETPEGWMHRLEVLPQRGPSDVREDRLFDLRIGDSEFDARWTIFSDDETFAREFLDGAARQALEDLRNLGGADEMSFSLSSTGLAIGKSMLLPGADELDLFASLGGRLHDRLVLLHQRAGGIEILDEPGEAGESQCRVCRSMISAETRVLCRRCRTPHHRDCWEFTGQCSTYACGEKKFTTKS